MYKLKTATLLCSLCFVAACSGIQHETPGVSAADEQAALAEIEAFPASGPVPPAEMSTGTARLRLEEVYSTIKPSAVEVCRFAGETEVCAWVVHYNDAHEYNAVAMDGNQVIVFHDIIAATDNDDELAFVLAHELGHHIADHIDETRKQRNSGILIAGLAMAALSSGTGCNTYACLSGLQNASQASMQLGGHLGGRVFSVEQEKEADYLAAHIINLSGYDLAKSRKMLVKIGTKTDAKTTAFLSSHPAGPERLASYDKTIELVHNDPDGFPGMESIETVVPLVPDKPKPDSNEFDPNKCRIYIPDGNVCIY